ncbi:HD domain-containing phosphohydrolase [Peptococcaceae bacterium 1198_IL3148]
MKTCTKTVNVKNKYFLIFSYILSVTIAIIVYVTGGTTKVYANLMYFPIAIVASTNGKKHGVIHAAVSALLVGNIMPLDVDLNISQDSINWILRLIIYTTIAYVIGFFAEYYRREFEKNRNKDKEIAETQLATIYSLVKLSESRDDETGAHIERVALFCKLLASELRNLPQYQDYINDDYVDNIFKASPLHDIGKVGIPDSILLKPGKLSTEEFEIMKTHTVIGANTLLEVKKKYPDNKFLELGISITRFHHERWDGSGYPDGLSGQDIPLSARIMAIVDVYDALRSKRVYKEAHSHEESMKIIKQGEGSHFDPEILQVFVQNEARFNAIYEQLNKGEVDFEHSNLWC